MDPDILCRLPTLAAEGRVNIPQECCCGSADCAFLALSSRALEALEGDVRLAAGLGQVRWSLSLSVFFTVQLSFDPVAAENMLLSCALV